MGLNHDQVQLIKHTWSIFRDMNPAIVGDVFYGKLFLEYPSLRKMFPKKMDEQYKKLMDMLSIIVARLDNMDNLLADIAAMARRHVEYGVKPEHYPPVGSALLWTLEQGLGKDWNDAAREAWTSWYTLIADTMINAASGQTV